MQRVYLVLLIIAMAFFSGCVGEEVPQETQAPTKTTPATQTMEYANPDALIDASWVAQHKDDSNVKIISTPSIKDRYDDGHIPGALYVDYRTDIVDLDASVENQMASMDKVEELLRSLGIKNSDTVVVYDDVNNMMAARMFNVLSFYGHRDVRLLNGGKNAWTRSGGELSEEVSTINPSDYSARDKSEAEYVGLEYVYDSLDNPDVIIVDARPADQYTGENIRPGIGRGGGHIPGAINVPGGKSWDEDKVIKSYEELKAIYEDVGVTKDKRIVVYCHNGLLSSYSWYVLNQLLGYPDVAVYDGSSLEWSNNPDVPLVTGSEPGEVPMDM